ncbi:MAG: hypothetical protein JO209_08570 [Acidisphaera sp.]|nr:hypothetical protein [Acidisphaera sp.]
MSAGGAARLAGCALLFAVLGAMGGGIVGLIAGVANLTLNPVCSAAGDEGACAMGIPQFVLGFAGMGALAAAAATLTRGVVRQRRPPPG